jgi:hypothetical protein
MNPGHQNAPARSYSSGEGTCEVLAALASQTTNPIPDLIRAEHGWLPKPPDRGCTWCDAGPGEPCLAFGRRQPARRRRLYLAPDGCHPSRRQAA